MKVFIWQWVAKLTGSFHSEGGLVVFAETVERAVALAEAEYVKFNGEQPSDIREVVGGEEAVYIFPDAGCC